LTGRRGSLSVVGTGIKVVSQTSAEAVACIESAEKVYYLAADALTQSASFSGSAAGFHASITSGRTSKRPERLVTGGPPGVVWSVSVGSGGVGRPRLARS